MSVIIEMECQIIVGDHHPRTLLLLININFEFTFTFTFQGVGGGEVIIVGKSYLIFSCFKFM